MPTEDEILALKKRHSASLMTHSCVAGVGVERDEQGDFALTVHLTGDAPDLPEEIEGHPVRYVRRGPYEKQ
jgi:hypothetical protein